MTEPNDFRLLELATPYALHAVSDAERADIDRSVAAAPASIAAAFTNEVRAVRETMAAMSAAITAEPPEQLRAATLATVQPDTGRRTTLAFTVEPGAGSPQPTGAILAQLPLS